VIESLPAVTKILKETVDGTAKILEYLEDRNEYSEKDCCILLYNMMLYLFEKEPNQDRLISEFEFPNGAEYQFNEKSDEMRLIITDKSGKQISLIIQDNILY
jgi:hypothetical protein